MRIRIIRKINIVRSIKTLLTDLIITLMLLAITGSHSMAQQAPAPSARPAFMMANPIVSPEILSDGRVIFRLDAKNASEVTITGEWMAMDAAAKLIKDDAGLWSVTLGPLVPEFYGYTFSVDGVMVLDPSNSQIKRDGSRNASVLLVPGKGSDLYAPNKVPHGTLSKVWYESRTLGLTRRMYVYTPRATKTVRSNILYYTSSMAEAGMKTRGLPWDARITYWTT